MNQHIAILFLIFFLISCTRPETVEPLDVETEEHIEVEYEEGLDEEPVNMSLSQPAWVYQLKEEEFMQFQVINLDFLVLDTRSFPKEDIELLSKGKTVLSYLNVGDKTTAIERVDDVIERGFEGVLLDKFEAETVKEISEHVKNASFKIFVQDRLELAVNITDYIDGVVKQNTWFEEDLRRNKEKIDADLVLLEQIKNAGKDVLVIEYLTLEDDVCWFYKKAMQKNYYASAGYKDLNRLPRQCTIAGYFQK